MRWTTAAWLARSLVVASSALVGCASPVDDGPGEDAAAIAVARGSLAPAAERARVLAEELGRAGYRDRGWRELPATDLSATFPSATFGAWRTATVMDAESVVQGLMFIPTTNAPVGSFGLLVFDAQNEVAALAAYVPDSAPDAARIVRAILDALPVDGTSLTATSTGDVATRGLLSPKVLSAGIEIAASILHELRLARASSKLALRTEATLAAKVQSPMWKSLAKALDPTKTFRLLSQISANRLAFGGRSVVLVHVEEGIYDVTKVWGSLSRHLGPRASKVGMAVPGTIENNSAIAWALKNDVPVVVNTISEKTPRQLLESIAEFGPGEEARAIARAALSDPKKLALVRIVDNPQLGWNFADEQAFVPLWAMADEALGIMTKASRDPMFDWFRRFEGALFAMP
jgi:hypothetical protein